MAPATSCFSLAHQGKWSWDPRPGDPSRGRRSRSGPFSAVPQPALGFTPQRDSAGKSALITPQPSPSFLTIITSRHLKEVEHRSAKGIRYDVNLLCPQHFGAELGWLLSSNEAGSAKPHVLSLRKEEIQESCLLPIAGSDFSLYRA